MTFTELNNQVIKILDKITLPSGYLDLALEILNEENALEVSNRNILIDNQQKALFDELCAQFGMSANTAINIFVRTVNRCRKIPFTISAESNNDIRENALNVFSELRKEAEAQEGPEMTLDEINTEIKEVRKLKNERNGICSY